MFEAWVRKNTKPGRRGAPHTKAQRQLNRQKSKKSHTP